MSLAFSHKQPVSDIGLLQLVSEKYVYIHVEMCVNSTCNWAGHVVDVCDDFGKDQWYHQ